MDKKGGSLATLSGMNQYFTIKVLGEVLGKKVLVMIYGGVTLNVFNENIATTKKMKI